MVIDFLFIICVSVAEVSRFNMGLHTLPMDNCSDIFSGVTRCHIRYVQNNIGRIFKIFHLLNSLGFHSLYSTSPYGSHTRN